MSATLAAFAAGDHVRLCGMVYEIKAQHGATTELFGQRIGKVITIPSVNRAELAIIPTEAQVAAQAETERLVEAEGNYLAEVKWQSAADFDFADGTLIAWMEYVVSGGARGTQSIAYGADGECLDVVDWGTR